MSCCFGGPVLTRAERAAMARLRTQRAAASTAATANNIHTTATTFNNQNKLSRSTIRSPPSRTLAYPRVITPVRKHPHPKSGTVQTRRKRQQLHSTAIMEQASFKHQISKTVTKGIQKATHWVKEGKQDQNNDQADERNTVQGRDVGKLVKHKIEWVKDKFARLVNDEQKEEKDEQVEKSPERWEKGESADWYFQDIMKEGAESSSGGQRI